MKLSEVGELPVVLTLDETATILRRGRSSTYEAARRGEIPTIRVGRRLVVPTAKLLELLGVRTGDPPERETTAAGNGGRPNRGEEPLERAR